MRLGAVDAAVAGFGALAERGGEAALPAQYFRGKLLLLRTATEAAKAAGAAELRAVIERDPLGYYGVQARQRLIDGGMDPGPPPELEPLAEAALAMDPEARYRRARDTFAALRPEFAGLWPSLARADALHAAGYLDEATRHLRATCEAFDNLLDGRRSDSGPRSEAVVQGIGWLAEWEGASTLAPKPARAIVRDAAARERLRSGLVALARDLDAPHYAAKLDARPSLDRRAKWHPRAYREVIEREAARRALAPETLWALMYTESRFRRMVVSHVGARGALQIMPVTARKIATELDLLDGGRYDPDRLFDIEENGYLAAWYVRALMDRFAGQAPLVYASYNGGPSNVARWVTAKSARPLELDEWIEEIPIRETYRYTKRVMEVEAAYHLLYRGELPRWSNRVDALDRGGVTY
jgi:soluble lytic murein transglycosylase-like protein